MQQLSGYAIANPTYMAKILNMTEIIESRIIKVRDKVITLDNIRRIASIISKHYNKTRESSNDRCRIKYNATCFDDSSFESSDISIFSDDSVLATKRVSYISIIYSSYESSESIDVSLSHGNSDYRNHIKVSGSDSTWVNGMSTNLEREISAFLPQNKFLTEYKNILEIIFAIGIGSLYFYFISLIPFEPSQVKIEKPPKWLLQFIIVIKDQIIFSSLIKYGLSYSIGIWPAYKLMDKLKSLWPSIEFQIGPEHSYIEKQRRLWFLAAFSVGIIPLIRSFLYDMMKMFLN
jgi:hypothetical protein